MKRRHNLIFITAVWILFVFSCNCLAQDKAAEIDEFLKLCFANGHLNGTALVAEGGKVIFKKGYGFADMEWDIPNTPDIKFRLGSITKQFTSMLIMQLVEEGKIDLEGKL